MEAASIPVSLADATVPWALTHIMLLFTEELGPNMLLSKCAEFALPLRVSLAGSSKSSKFAVTAAVSKEERERGRGGKKKNKKTQMTQNQPVLQQFLSLQGNVRGQH